MIAETDVFSATAREPVKNFEKNCIITVKKLDIPLINVCPPCDVFSIVDLRVLPVIKEITYKNGEINAVTISVPSAKYVKIFK